MKKYRATVTTTENRTYEVLVAAASEQDAQALAREGEWDEVISDEYAGTLDTEVFDVSVADDS